MRTLDNETICENENIDPIEACNQFEFDIDEKYEYVSKGIIFNICSNLLYYVIAFPILKVVTKVVYNLKIEGKEKIRSVKKGAVTISNHVLVLDCAMVGLACGKKKIYYTTRQESFEIPFVRKLIKLLRAIPIPRGINNKKCFKKAIDSVLQQNKMVHFYPEASLLPYCETLRNFKDGAFKFASNNEVPIIPMVFKFEDPTGVRKIFKSKKDVTLIILDPIISYNKETSKKINVDDLKEKAYENMKNAIK